MSDVSKLDVTAVKDLKARYASAVANDRRHLVIADLPAFILDEQDINPRDRLH